MSPEERKEVAIYNHIWSIVDVLNEDQMSKARSYVCGELDEGDHLE